MQWRFLLAKLANEGFLSPPYCAETSHTTWADQNKKWFQTTRCFLFFYYYREGHLGISNYFWLSQQYCRARKPRLEESCLPCISGGQYHKEPGFFLQLQTFSLKGKEKKKIGIREDGMLLFLNFIWCLLHPLRFFSRFSLFYHDDEANLKPI